MHSLIALLLLAVAAVDAPTTADIETSALGLPRLEIVVVEEPNCLYCTLFRRDLFPAYAASPRAREVPMRFINVAELDASRLHLTRAVDVVPTVLVMKEGAEIGRVPGYATREIFFSAINAMLPLSH